MTKTNATSVNRPSQAVRAEAAAWIARLHAPDRTVADEESFRRWLSANPMHAVAFERMTTLWEAGTRLKSDALTRLKVRADRHAESSPHFPRLSWVAVGIIVAIAGGLWHANDDAVETRVGEQRTLTLEDGTRVTLNTATRLEVRYDKKQRRVEVDTGEALFEVKAQPGWPFVVTAGENRITALGTAFVVRREPEALLVTLVEGKVAVSGASRPSAPQWMERGGAGGVRSFPSPSDGEEQGARNPSRSQEEGGSNSRMRNSGLEGDERGAIILTPGQRLTLVSKKPPKLDRPAMDRVTAWRQGVIPMDRMPLSVAVTEMNRYSSVPLVIEGFDADRIQVSGVFKAGDSLEFAHALVRSHSLYAVDGDRGIVLSRRREK